MVAYNRCLQISFIVVQLLFIAIGLTLVGLGAWLEIEEQSIQAVINQQQLLFGPYIIIAVGCIIVLIAFIGMVGACCDNKLNRFLLGLYIALVLLAFAAQLVGGILGFVYRDRVFDVVRVGLEATIDQYQVNGTTSDRAIVTAWDFVQMRFNCCGIDGAANWRNNSMVMIEGGAEVPVSCCPSSDCTDFAVDEVQGCLTALQQFVSNNLLIIASVAIAFLVGEVLVVLMAFCLLCCTDFDDDKA